VVRSPFSAAVRKIKSRVDAQQPTKFTPIDMAGDVTWS
jgi:hypothetical protein